MALNFCPGCGAKLENPGRFCKKCGAPLPGQADGTERPTQPIETTQTQPIEARDTDQIIGDFAKDLWAHVKPFKTNMAKAGTFVKGNVVLCCIAFAVPVLAALLWGWWAAILILIVESAGLYLMVAYSDSMGRTKAEQWIHDKYRESRELAEQEEKMRREAEAKERANVPSPMQPLAQGPVLYDANGNPLYAAPPQTLYDANGNPVQVPMGPQYAASAQTPQQTVIVNGKQSNGVGTAGLVFALLTWLGFPIPGVGIIASILFLVLGALLSLVGLFGKPKGAAVAGLIICGIDVFLVFAAISAMGGFLGI